MLIDPSYTHKSSGIKASFNDVANNNGEKNKPIAMDVDITNSLPSDFDDVLAQLHGTSLSNNPNYFEIGKLYPNEGVYIGEAIQTISKDNLRFKTFDLFTTPVDLGFFNNYDKLIKEVSLITNLYSHNGASFKEDKDFYKAIHTNNYNGEWFLPTADTLQKNFYKNKDVGVLKNSFVTGGDSTSWYYSRTKYSGLMKYSSPHNYFINFVHGLREELNVDSDIRIYSARLVRAKLK